MSKAVLLMLNQILLEIVKIFSLSIDVSVPQAVKGAGTMSL